MNELIPPRYMNSFRKTMIAILISLVLGLLLRLILAATNAGYANDIALFSYWSDLVYYEGIANFYHADIFVDYPPGYMYILYILGALKTFLQIEQGTSSFLILYKLPAIAADMIASVFIYRLARQKWENTFCLSLMLIYLFNPVVLLDSAVWGQVDSIFTLIVVISIYYFSQGSIARASIMFAIAALIKPQAFIFMPLVFIALWYKKSWTAVLKSAGYGLGSFLLLALPFFYKGGGIKQLYMLYEETLASYPYATLNAFNLYTLFHKNWVPISETLGPFPIHIWGSLGIIAAIIFAGWFGLSGKLKQKQLYYIGAIIISIVFIFVTKMHERYMFPILLLLLAAFIESGERKILYLFAGFTFTNFINIYYVLALSEQTTYVPFNGISFTTALANIVLMLYMIYVGYTIYIRRREGEHAALDKNQKQPTAKKQLENAFSHDAALNKADSTPAFFSVKALTKKDWSIMLIVTAVYAAVAFIQLGSFHAPKSVWEPASNGQSVVIDLGESKNIARILTFAGVGSGQYSIQFGNDPNAQWSEEIITISDHVSVFTWQQHDVTAQARYIKLSATKLGFSLHELAIFEAESGIPLPIAKVFADSNEENKRGSIENLIDEQSIVPSTPTFMNGTYFDEIYHARTAYEHIEHLPAYESTHPPLGKILIGIGLKLFGFSPFGWRVVGTLFGIAMLPLMYLLAKACFRKTTYASTAIILLAAECMHFTQTRIATIDVYAVFFIMLMFYFMQQFTTRSYYTNKLSTTLIPLALAGIAFGFGIAAKWIVFYGGAGLAVMLGIVLYERFAQYRTAKALIRNTNSHASDYSLTEIEHMTKKFIPYTLITLATCILFFIVVPGAIYALSYIPVLTVQPTGYTFKSFIDYQVNMFQYHSGLVSSHPFASPWWEWPFLKRPVWYYVQTGLDAGLKSTIAVIGNPLIWWTGIFTMVATIVISLKKKDKRVYMIFIAYLSQYIPWMLVARETFLYHYFAMIPFLILSIVYIAQWLEERNPVFYKIRIGYVLVACILFIMFYPAISGMSVSEQYINNVLRWFPSWVF